MSNGLLDEQDITVFRLANALREQGLNALPGDNGTLLLRDGNGLDFQLGVDRDRRIITLRTWFGFRRDCPRLAQLELVNLLNARMVMARWYATDAGLCCDYQMPFAGGVPARQLAVAALLYMRVVPAGLLQYDTANLVI